MDELRFLSLNEHLGVEDDLLQLSLIRDFGSNRANDDYDDGDVSMQDVSAIQETNDSLHSLTIDTEQVKSSKPALQLKSLMHPTELGARFAQSEKTGKTADARDQVEEEILDLGYVGTSAYRSYDQTEFEAKRRGSINELPDHYLQSPTINEGRPFSVHHHYYFPSQAPMKENTTLPQPWSKKSTPNSKWPYLISTYLQLAMNTLTALYAMKLVYDSIQTIKQDVDRGLKEKLQSTYFEMRACRQNFLDNNCQLPTRAPALRDSCQEWKNCMNRNPMLSLNYSTLIAEIFGATISSFVEPLGIKSFLLLVVFLVCNYWANFGCGFLRAKSYYGWQNVDSNFNDQSPIGAGTDTSSFLSVKRLEN
ncbi:hypothetical protein OGAPHI_000161 [Ogataea philodendri]|uniref:Brl1/Brr6 domain-containing protein n=1 Tax=Ogataea philodendri TaxID=1378263 RepID=A0A9P8TB33_9ASCO|nr:uncharacterized protein OGAPHI_000161 [Ogataea philodendri]KAH3671975.1 hypothetical protein OGAPHI_000161 [Ogataea philodendri]